MCVRACVRVVYVRACINVHACIFVLVRAYLCVHVWADACAYACTYVCLCELLTCLRECVRVCVVTCRTFVTHTHTHTPTHTHTHTHTYPIPAEEKVEARSIAAACVSVIE